MQSKSGRLQFLAAHLTLLNTPELASDCHLIGKNHNPKRAGSPLQHRARVKHAGVSDSCQGSCWAVRRLQGSSQLAQAQSSIVLRTTRHGLFYGLCQTTHLCSNFCAGLLFGMSRKVHAKKWFHPSNSQYTKHTPIMGNNKKMKIIPHVYWRHISILPIQERWYPYIVAVSMGMARCRLLVP